MLKSPKQLQQKVFLVQDYNYTQQQYGKTLHLF